MGRNANHWFPLPLKRTLEKLGSDLKDARRRRRIPTALMAERCGISRSTLLKAEKGEPAVSIGVYATILFVLGMSERIAELADSSRDKLGLSLEEERLPKRIRIKK
jgi:transcriptional regulator with XRE-family HTH domain